MLIVNSMRKLGWLCFALMWIPFVLAVMGTGNFDSPADGFGSFIDMIGGWHILGFVIGGVGFAFIFGASAVNSLLNQRILHKGEDGIAKITGTDQTGEMVGDSPVLDFTLDVRPSNYPSFIGQCRKTTSLADLGSIGVGTIVGVKFMPGSTKVVIAGAAADGGEAEQLFSSRSAPFGSPSQVKPQHGSASKYILGSLAIILIPVVVIGFIAYVFLISSRHTAEYNCAVSELEKNANAEELFGKPIELGLMTTGNVSGGSSHRNAYFDTSISGSKGSGKLHVQAFRIKDSVSTLYMTVIKNGKKTVIYDDVYPCK